MEEINSAGDNLLVLVIDKLCLGRISPIHSRLRVSAGENQHHYLFPTLWGVNVSGTHAEDMIMTSHRDFSAPVPAGESACGGLVD